VFGYWKKPASRPFTRKKEENLPIRPSAAARTVMDDDAIEVFEDYLISYYNDLIQNNPEWEFAGVYADNFISGTSVERRAEFKRMIQDCEDGKIVIILTKSISRFARNTVDLLNTVRRLKELDIEVQFEKERIRSLSGDGELMLTLLASLPRRKAGAFSKVPLTAMKSKSMMRIYHYAERPV